VTDRTIDDVLAGLDAVIDRAIETGDRRGYFAVLYRTVTAEVKERIATGGFDDAERMERLDVIFADRYLDAVAAQDAGGTPTASWQLAFAAGRARRHLVLQHLLVGINAHINLDLGIAAATCSPGEELLDLRDDYDRINAILAAMVVGIQRDLVEISPWMRLLDRFGARTQREVVRFSIVTARAGAWRFASDLAALPEERWDAHVGARDGAVARVGARILHPGVWMSAGLRLVRLRERGDVAANLELLRQVPPPSTAAVEAQLAEPSLEP
jgi:hypothetical protein